MVVVVVGGSGRCWLSEREGARERGRGADQVTHERGERGKKKKKVCVCAGTPAARRWRHQNLLHPISQLPSGDRGSTRTCCHNLPPPVPLPNPSHLLCPASVSHTSGILPSSQESERKRERELSRAAVGGSWKGRRQDRGGGAWGGCGSREASGGRRDEAEEEGG